MANTTVGQYIFKRLAQLGIKHIFGVPGDFNMPLLDEMLDTKQVTWIGDCNELNAAYAADGYARAMGVPGAFVTTYGVGEMSAINGISGSHCESVPVIHIVGIPSREAVADTPFLHHAPAPTGLSKANFLDYVKSATPFSVAQEVLEDLSTVHLQVDSAIKAALRFKRPAYIFVPVDITGYTISADPLEQKLELPPSTIPQIKTVAQKIVDGFKNSKKSVIVADALAQRYNLGPELNMLMVKTGSYGATTIMGKGVLDETSPNFLGCYGGIQSRKEVREQVESSDFVLDVGAHHSDYNTGVFTTKYPQDKYVSLTPLYCKVFGKTINASIFSEVLEAVCAAFKDEPDQPAPTKIPHILNTPTKGRIEANDFLNLFSKSVKDDDMVIVETGSYQPGSGEIVLQKNGRFICQVGYASIGYTLPAAVGAAVALKDTTPNGRVLLVEGDGSAQMTVQELSTAIRYGLRLTIFLINNEGYLIERALHGPTQSYNDIASWDWTTLFKALGKDGKHKTYQAHNVEEFNEIVNDAEFQNADYPQLVEVFCGKFDYPSALSGMANANNERNAKLNKEWAETHDI